MATELDQFADEVDNFNTNLRTCLAVVAGSLGVMAATTWIPGVDLVTDGASLAVDAADVEEATGLINALRTVLGALSQRLGGRFAFNVARSLAINYSLNWASRALERGLLLGDPTEGWSRYDQSQLLALAGITAAVDLVVPATALGQWAARSSGRVPAGGSLPWAQFARGSAVRLGQTLVLANAFNFINQAWIEGRGLNFPAWRVFEVGSGNTAAQTLIVIAGDSVAFLLTRGASELSPALTIPALTAVSTTADVGAPGLSPLVRQAKGLNYETAAGKLSVVLPSDLDEPPMILDQLPSYVVRPGDTLWAIAQRQYGDPETTFRFIESANHVTDPRRLQIGQVLLLPGVPESG